MNPLRKKLFSAALGLISAASLIFFPAAGFTFVQAEDLMSGIEAADKSLSDDLTAGTAAAADFSVKLFQQSLTENKNTMISPLSVLYALAMTANGAKGETLAQMESVLGMSVSELNDFLSSYKNTLSSDDQCKINLANSIWFNSDSGFTANPDFLQTNADYYGASIYKESFSRETLSLINSWVEEQTMGMIDRILNDLPASTVMCLVNALAFDGEWENVYEESQVNDGIFTTQDGEEQTVKMMYSDEDLYLKDTNAKGFLKYYAGRKYAFAALLPDSSISAADYAASLTGKKLTEILANAQKTSVSTATPVFKSEFSVKMNEILKNMGMELPFDENLADFSGLGTSTAGNLCISDVIHKTYISVDEKGTEAAASTAVLIAECALAENKEVYLDRPFVYMIVDCETNLPVFIGTLMNPES